MRMLIVEDEQALALVLKQHLEAEGHQVEIATDGNAGLAKAIEAEFDLVLLDLNLPGCDGTEILSALRLLGASTAIIVLSGRTALEDRLKCFELGADDCLAKPFALRELTVRIQAVCRRTQAGAAPVLRCADLELNRVQRSVVRSGRKIDLSAREYALVEYLIQHKGHCVPRAALLKNVWEMPEQSSTNVVEVYVNYLRRKVDQGFDKPLIHTVRGEGYVMRELSSPPSRFPAVSDVARIQWQNGTEGRARAFPANCSA
jgi:DNA-binding response OmpR family regulator